MLNFPKRVLKFKKSTSVYLKSRCFSAVAKDSYFSKQVRRQTQCSQSKVPLHSSSQKPIAANPLNLKWSYVHGASNVPLLGTTIGKQLQKIAETHHDRAAMIFANEKLQLTFTELLEKADMFAAGLRALGFKHGDRVGIWGPNSLEWVLTEYGTARGGMVLVNINPSYRKNELKYALNKVGCKGLVAASSYKDINYISMLRELMPEMDNTLEGSPLNAKEAATAEKPISHK